MNEQEHKAALTICLLAAFADGNKDDRERDQIKRIAESLAAQTAIDVSKLYQDVLLGNCGIEEAASSLTTADSRQTVYEMAVGVCDADGGRNAAETAFLERLRTALKLDIQAGVDFATSATAIANTPVNSGATVGQASAVDAATLDKLILNHSILNGALELLPQSLASMAIMPLQLKMVYRIGKAHGFELDQGHIKDFAATLGVGLTGQFFEQIGRKLFGGLIKSIGGGVLGGVGSAATGTAFSFATTYALGQVAKQYYAGGRKIDMVQLKAVFTRLLGEGKAMQGNYVNVIKEKAKTINMTEIVDLVRQT
jgi:uncharacterized protein (DUF697 family)/tellurite resistance protein